MQIRVIIADQNQAFRRKTAARLHRLDNVEIVAQAQDGQEAADLAEAIAFDVALLNPSLPVIDGIEVTRRIRRVNPEAQILMLSDSESVEILRESLAAGARGFIAREATFHEIAKAIVRVSRAEPVLDKNALEIVLDYFVNSRPQDEGWELRNRIENLPKHLRDTAYYLGCAYSNKQIAAAMGLKESSASTYVKQVLAELGCRRAELIRAAGSLGSDSDSFESLCPESAASPTA